MFCYPCRTHFVKQSGRWTSRRNLFY